MFIAVVSSSKALPLPTTPPGELPTGALLRRKGTEHTKKVDIECAYLPKPHLWHPVAGLVTDLKKQARWEQCGYKMVQELSELLERFQKPFP